MTTTTPTTPLTDAELELCELFKDQDGGMSVVAAAAAEIRALRAERDDLLAALKRIVAIKGSSGGPKVLVAEFQFLAEAAIARAEGRAEG